MIKAVLMEKIEKKFKLAFDKSKIDVILNARYAEFERPRKGGAEKSLKKIQKSI